jgi:hypothetical protein
MLRDDDAGKDIAVMVAFDSVLMIARFLHLCAELETGTSRLHLVGKQGEKDLLLEVLIMKPMQNTIV